LKTFDSKTIQMGSHAANQISLVWQFT